MNKTVIAFFIFGILSCSVKTREQPPRPNPTALPNSIRLGETNKIMAKEISGGYLPGKENIVRFRVVGEDLKPLNPSEVTLKVEYDMPSMPKMGGPWRPNVKWISDGEFETIFDIAHGGVWTFKLTISRHDETIDVIRYQLDIKD